MEDELSLAQYQSAAHSTAIYPAARAIEYLALGLCSEAGEIAGLIKKALRDNGGELSAMAISSLEAELGDVLWYVAELCTASGCDLLAVAERNVSKLRDRAERGVIGGSGDNR